MIKKNFIAALLLMQFNLDKITKVYFSKDNKTAITLMNKRKHKGVCTVQILGPVTINIKTGERQYYPTHRFYDFKKALRYVATAE